jgi:hypothetical protein
MIVEQRIYTIIPGQVAAYLKLYEAEGFAIQKEHLGRLLGYFYSEIGVVNQIVHLWAYANHADREQRRARLFADPRWLAYFGKIILMIQRQESSILIPATFSPIGAATELEVLP